MAVNIKYVRVLLLLTAMCLIVPLAPGIAYAKKPDCGADPSHPSCGGDDTIPPSLITDFQSYLPTSDTIRLGWTGSGDDGDSGTADHYVLLQAEQPDPAACDGSVPYDFDYNVVELSAPSPSNTGGNGGHEVWAEGLNPETCYAFSIEPFDEAGNHPGPSFAANMTQAAPIAGAWRQEILPGDTYSKILEFDPGTMQPVVFANDDSTYFFTRSSDGTWTSQTVKKNGSGGISLAYNSHPDLGLTFGGGLQSHRNVPSYAELQPDGSWDVTQITRDRVRGHSLAFDSDGIATVAFRKVDGRILQLARFNGSSFDIEEPVIPNGQGTGWGAGLKFDPVTEQPTIAYTSEDHQEILIATYNGIAWSVESIYDSENIDANIGMFSYEYGPNNQPVIIFRQALDTRYEYWMRMIRRDAFGNWSAAMTIDPHGLINQNGADLAIAGDGTLYVSMANTGNQVRVGRFCEINPLFGCTPTMDTSGLENVWLWETVAGAGPGGNTSIAIDESNSTVAIVADEYFWCDPDPERASVICGTPPLP